ncbi:MAG: zinc-binding dehydrogenase [Quadrisphaera sp.]
MGGAGPIGLLLAALLKARGLRVLLTEVSEARKAKARDTGVAEEVLDPREGSVADRVRELTGGRGCRRLLRVLQRAAGARHARRRREAGAGVVVNVSIWGHRAELDIQSLVLKEVDLRGTIGYAGDHPATIRLVQEGKVDLEPFITHRIGLDELVEVGYDTLLHRTETAVKILVSPTSPPVIMGFPSTFPV